MRLGESFCPYLKIVLAKVQPAKGGGVFSVSKHNDGYMRHAKAYSHGKARICVLAKFCLVDISLSLYKTVQNSGDISGSIKKELRPLNLMRSSVPRSDQTSSL